MTKRLLLAAALCIAGASTLPAQNIRNHYVSKAETDGVIYHTFPVTLFENREAGDLTFDITYKEHRGGRATINFTCRMAQAVPADSVRFAADAAVMSGPVDKLYLEPEKKQWKHRYTFDADGSELCGFFDERALPEVTVYVGGKPYVYRAKRSAWRSYAPIGYRIFDMIRVNEQWFSVLAGIFRPALSGPDGKCGCISCPDRTALWRNPLRDTQKRRVVVSRCTALRRAGRKRCIQPRAPVSKKQPDPK